MRNLSAVRKRIDLVAVGKLRQEERISLELSLYFKNRGFEEYKMGAFEEYSVYMDNKDFLLNKNMAVFAGLDGKLYALRPDVTLSVVKNAVCVMLKSSAVQPLYSNMKYSPAVMSGTVNAV